MKPGIEDMQVFLVVVEARSFTLAAERLGKTKSAVSQTISRLENDLGSKLLYRSTRSLSLTDSGSRLLSYCQDIRHAYLRALDDIKTKPTGVLTITAPHALSDAVINPAIIEFMQMFPDIEIKLIAEDSAVDLIAMKVDVAVRVGKLSLQSIKVSKLGGLHESLYASPDYIAEKGGHPQSAEALSTWAHLASEWQGNPINQTLSNGWSYRVQPKLRCNALHDLIHLTLMGGGVARLPEISVKQQVAEKRLVKLAEVAVSPVYYMHPFSHTPPLKVREFIKLLKKRF